MSYILENILFFLYKYGNIYNFFYSYIPIRILKEIILLKNYFCVTTIDSNEVYYLRVYKSDYSYTSYTFTNKEYRDSLANYIETKMLKYSQEIRLRNKNNMRYIYNLIKKYKKNKLIYEKIY